jgi:hypothetical protein
MDLKFVKDLPEETGYDNKKGDTVENAEEVFGAAQTRYFIETGHAEPVKGKTETATLKANTETADKK